MPVSIADAANVRDPVLLVIRSKGYVIELEQAEDGEEFEETWRASRDGSSFVANNPLSVLGLIALFEGRGEDWSLRPEEDAVVEALYEEI